MASCCPSEGVQPYGVVGAGAIGSGIARLLSGLGAPTTVVAPRPGGVERASERIRRWYASDVRHGRLTGPEAETGLRNVCVTSSFKDLEAATFVIESVPEDIAVKQDVLAAVEAHTAPDCVFASNTSAIPLTDMAARADRPHQVIGTHFFWPAHRYRLVEIARANLTSELTLQRALNLVRWLGKVPLVVHDRPGFFTTRVLVVYLSEAIALVRDGASVEAVDRAMEAFGWAMGPFRLLDAVGLQIFRGIHQRVSPSLGDRVAAFEHLWPVLEAGHVGCGNGRRDGAKGFYRYPEGLEVDARVYPLIGRNGGSGPASSEIAVRPIWQLLNEVGHCLTDGTVASTDEADVGLRLGLGWPAAQGSLLTYARRVGVPSIVQQLEAWAQRHGPRFAPSPAWCAW